MNPVFILALIFLTPGLIALAAGIVNSAPARRVSADCFNAPNPMRKPGRPRKQPEAAEADMPKRKPGRPHKQTKAAEASSPKPEPAENQQTQAQRPKAISDTPFYGEVVAFTGTNPKMERRYMISHTERLGGRAYERINTRCTLLVVGENPGQNQLESAAKWHTKTISWQEWHRRAFGYDAVVASVDVQGMTLDEFAASLANAA